MFDRHDGGRMLETHLNTLQPSSSTPSLPTTSAINTYVKVEYVTYVSIRFYMRTKNSLQGVHHIFALSVNRFAPFKVMSCLLTHINIDVGLLLNVMLFCT